MYVPSAAVQEGRDALPDDLRPAEATLRKWLKEVFPLRKTDARVTRTRQCDVIAPPPRFQAPVGVPAEVRVFWDRQRSVKFKKVVSLDMMKLREANAATVNYVLGRALQPSSVAFDDAYVLHLRGVELHVEGMGLLLDLLRRHQRIFAINLGEMGNRSMKAFWEPFVLAVERFEVGIVFGFADNRNGDVTDEYAVRLRKAFRANRTRLEAPGSFKTAPWRDAKFRSVLRKNCPSGCKNLDYAFGKAYWGAACKVWETG